jgi:hypothetical protein
VSKGGKKRPDKIKSEDEIEQLRRRPTKIIKLKVNNPKPPAPGTEDTRR